METGKLTLLKTVADAVNATEERFHSLLRVDVNTQPLLYFGDPIAARFATFGVNPSAAEFTSKRWPKTKMTIEELDARSTDYFKNPTILAHRWFDGYQKALELLGHSYQADTVHLDLSPRATKSMGSVDPKQFAVMVAHDMKWFLMALGLCRNLKAGIMSGSVTGRYHFDRFLLKHLPVHYALTLRTRFELRRYGATSLYDLTGPNLNIPVFFCSQSPSGDGGIFLSSEVTRLRTQLIEAGFSRSSEEEQAALCGPPCSSPLQLDPKL